MSHTQIRIASIVVGVIIVVLIAYGAFKLIGARATDVEPRDVVVSDISQNSVKVNWSTGQSSQGVVEYGTTATALNFFAPESEASLAHSVELTLLSPNTSYYFQIRIGDTVFTNGGVPWTFATTAEGEAQPASVSATPAPTSGGAPTNKPIQTIVIPNNPGSQQTIGSTCTYTDCQLIKANLGTGCTTQDYFKCIRSASPTP